MPQQVANLSMFALLATLQAVAHGHCLRKRFCIYETPACQFLFAFLAWSHFCKWCGIGAGSVPLWFYAALGAAVRSVAVFCGGAYFVRARSRQAAAGALWLSEVEQPDSTGFNQARHCVLSWTASGFDTRMHGGSASDPEGNRRSCGGFSCADFLFSAVGNFFHANEGAGCRGKWFISFWAGGGLLREGTGVGFRGRLRVCAGAREELRRLRCFGAFSGALFVNDSTAIDTR